HQASHTAEAAAGSGVHHHFGGRPSCSPAVVRRARPVSTAVNEPIAALTRGKFPIHGVIAFTRPLCATHIGAKPSFDPCTTEASQTEAALRTYRVRRRRDA
ncbi:hypothetical protein, partial [Paucibacter soli]|uniref:hypothetical protein n=1 Tax=Paucibacter soli TaxID=3133433 RepID=UPI0030AB8C47